MWTEQVREMILNGILETLYMTVVSTVCGYIFGLPMGVPEVPLQCFFCQDYPLNQILCFRIVLLLINLYFAL